MHLASIDDIPQALNFESLLSKLLLGELFLLIMASLQIIS
jgi:hypothetical protein